MVATQFAIPGLNPEYRLVLFAIPAVILGSFVGQLIFTRTP
jgi:hypothetical protein